MYSFAQEITKDTLVNESKKNFMMNMTDGMVTTVRETGRSIRRMGNKFNSIDTTFISPNLYNLAFMIQHTGSYEQYRLGSNGRDRNQSITFAPEVDYKMGLYFGWRWIFLGYSFDLKDIFGGKSNKKKKKELSLSLYSSKFGVDMYYRKTGNYFKIRSVRGFDIPEAIHDLNFDGLSSDIKGINAYYIFNYKRFSYPAVYSQSTNQRKSCGSLMAGFSYSQHRIKFDYEALPTELKSQLKEELKFSKVQYSDYSLNIGYGYNWVFTRNCVANLSLLPAIGYKKSKIDDTNANNYHWIHNVNFDLITRAGIVYNNAKYYAGLSLLIHSYDYRKPDFSITNSFGSLNLYIGFNFWKKPEYRKK